MQIEDGQGSSRTAGVNEENRLKVTSNSQSIQHHISIDEGQAYQVQAIDADVVSGTQTLLHLRNNSTTKYVVFTYLRMQLVTTETIPSSGSYFEVGVGDTVSSGGIESTPVNMNQSSGNLADVTATSIDPTMVGSFTAIDRQYVESNGKETIYNKEGTIILGKNNTISIRLTSTGQGEAKARMSFIMVDK